MRAANLSSRVPTDVRRSAAWGSLRSAYRAGEAHWNGLVLLLTKTSPRTTGHPVPDGLRLVIDEPGLTADAMGGAERSLLTVARLLSGRGHAVRYLSAEGLSEQPPTGARTSRVSHAQRAAAYEWADAVLTQKRAIHVALRAGKSHGRPIVFFVHGPGQLPRWGTPDLVVFNALWLENSEGEGLQRCTFPPPVSPEAYRVTPGDAATLVNLAAFKGAATFYAVAEKMPDRAFLGVEGLWGEQCVPQPLPQNVRIVPSTPDMRRIYRETRVLLMPSSHEPYGRVAVEAAASGIPTIAHPCEGLREAVGPGGIFVDRDDIDGWVAAIRRLDDSEEYARRSALARQWAEELHPARRIVELERRLYGMVCEFRQQGRRHRQAAT
jgi:hypothetical protein